MSNDSTAVDFGINLLEEEIDDVIFRTNEFLTDATFTGGQGPFWWILQMSMALAGLFAIIICAHMAYKMMVKREPLDVMKLFKPLAVSIVLCWWYPPSDTGMAGGSSTWCALDFLSYIPNAIGSYTQYPRSRQLATPSAPCSHRAVCRMSLMPMLPLRMKRTLSRQR